MHCGRLSHNFGAADITARSQGSLMISLDESEVRFHHKNWEDCNLKAMQHK